MEIVIEEIDGRELGEDELGDERQSQGQGYTDAGLHDLKTTIWSHFEGKGSFSKGRGRFNINLILSYLRVYQPIGSMLVKTNQTFSSYLIDYVDQHAINCFGSNRPIREITGWSLRYGTFQKMVLHR